MTAETTASTDHDRRLRLGVVRAADASTDPTVAEMEARVVRAELERRLGPVTLDLRTEGPTTGPWLPREHAAWPSDVDATIELGGLGDDAGHLVTLFARTVDPVAADVRGRMLHHLGVLPVDTALTDHLLAELLPAPARPTDLWLVIRSAADLATGEPAHRLLRADADADTDADTDADRDRAAALDRWFDDTVAALPVDVAPTIGRLRAQVDVLRARLEAAHDETRRAERAATEQIEHLTAERDSLRERLDRAQLDRAELDPAGGPRS